MDYGAAGDPARDFQGGYGLSHIIERRKLVGEDGEAIVREIIPDVLANGRLIEQPAHMRSNACQIIGYSSLFFSF